MSSVALHRYEETWVVQRIAEGRWYDMGEQFILYSEKDGLKTLANVMKYERAHHKGNAKTHRLVKRTTTSVQSMVKVIVGDR
jgi:hypothetical protein